MKHTLWILLLCTLTLSSAHAQTPPTTLTDAETGVTYTVERYLPANYPVALAFAPDGRLFYTEKTTGNVRVVSADGILQPEPVIHLPTTAQVERGMLGIALDPQYDENGMIWVVHTAEGDAQNYPANNLVRFYEENGIGGDPEIMLSIPNEVGTLIHNGGNVHFDAEGFLYLSVGDYDVPANAQDLTVLQGKIHRFAVTDEGLMPALGNPFEGISIFAYGLRNPFDFTFDPENGRIFATENGDNCDDEINLILPGFNYGQGEGYVCGGTATGVDFVRYLPGLIAYTPTEAPTGIVVYDDPAIPAWQDDLFYCLWNRGALVRAELNEARNAIIATHEIDLGGAQCRIDIAIGPEGGLYFSMVGEEGGAIYRLVSAE